MDTRAGSCYVSEALKGNLLKSHPEENVVEIYDVNIVNLKGDFELSAEVTKVEKNVILTIPNPEYQEMLKSHQHLNNITMDDQDEKAEHPIHVIIETNQYPKITTKTPQFGTQVESHRSRDHNSQAAGNALSALWYFSEVELEPVAG